jgi:DNA-binding IclR family transcriptional regulator
MITATFGDREGVDLPKLREELAVIRRQGYVLVDNGEHLNVAVPISPSGEAALSFTALPYDTPISGVVARLKDLAGRIATTPSPDH